MRALALKEIFFMCVLPPVQMSILGSWPLPSVTQGTRGKEEKPGVYIRWGSRCDVKQPRGRSGGGSRHTL